MRRSKAGSNYPDNWKEIANKVKEDAGWCCIRCGIPDQKRHRLTCHHLDMDPSNCEWFNIPALCQQCHLHIQAKVIMERVWILPHSEWFKPYYLGWVAQTVLGVCLSRAEVEQREAELLKLGQPWLFNQASAVERALEHGRGV